MGLILHWTAMFLSKKPWENQDYFQAVTSALREQDRTMRKGEIHVTNQKTLEEQLQVSCCLAHTILSARLVFVFGV